MTGDCRYKVSSISSFSVDGRSAVTGWWYITITMGKTEKKFAWEKEKEMRNYEAYLDSVLNVKEI